LSPDLRCTAGALHRVRGTSPKALSEIEMAGT
jgi:hypothetical protein